jgi:formylglycine-generating enzyme required for sulfatase activity
MHGNLWEWCEDLYGPGGSLRVLRGGGWNIEAASCRSAYRGRDTPVGRSFNLGFRVALVPVAAAELKSSPVAEGKESGKR